MRRPAAPAPRPPRRHQLVVPVQLPDRARHPVPPAPEHPAARRARQLPVSQLPLDYIPVTVYREHDHGFSQVTIGNDIGLLERALKALGRPWEVTPEDIDRVVGDQAAAGRTTATRREYVQIFKGFHRFLQARKAPEIQAVFGVRLVCPVDEFNASRHVGDDSPAELPPPSPERVAEFFEFLKTRIAGARKYAPAARDYALFRTLYHAGLRSEEAALLDRPDVHFGRGPFGKLHVRFGKGAHTSGPRPRWVPMLDGLDLVLRWFLDDVRGKFPGSLVLFADEFGGALAPGTIRNRLRYLMTLEGRPAGDWFSPHALRRACATHNMSAGWTWWRSSSYWGIMWVIFVKWIVWWSGIGGLRLPGRG